MSAGFNRFYILFLNIAIYRSSVEVPEEVLDSSEVTLYLASSQAPKSISLHRCEQKGKNFASLDCFLGDILTVFLQVGHLCFIREYLSTLFEPQIKYIFAGHFFNSKKTD